MSHHRFNFFFKSCSRVLCFQFFHNMLHGLHKISKIGQAQVMWVCFREVGDVFYIH
jgi:hypothetical protein